MFLGEIFEGVFLLLDKVKCYLNRFMLKYFIVIVLMKIINRIVGIKVFKEIFMYFLN